MSFTGGIGLDITDTQLTALINLLIGSIDSFGFDLPPELTAGDGAVTYSVDYQGSTLDITLSDIGININSGSIAIVFKITLPRNVPYVGFLLGGKSISIGLNPTIEIEDDGKIILNADIDDVHIGGITSLPGFSYLRNYLKNMIPADIQNQLTREFNPAETIGGVVNNLPGDISSEALKFELSIVDGKIGFWGPPVLSDTQRPPDYGSSTREEVADEAKTVVTDFIAELEGEGELAPGTEVEIVLTESDLTAMISEQILDVTESTSALDDETIEDVVINVDEDSLSLTTTVTLPENLAGLLPPELAEFAGTEIELGIVSQFETEDGDTVLGEQTIEMNGIDLTELGIDTEALGDFDIGTLLGLPEGTKLVMDEGILTIIGTVPEE